MSDVLVIGGGLAGAVAALAAAGAGATVTVVRRARGATAMGSGALEFLDASPGALERLAADEFHPYGRVSGGDAAWLRGRLEEAAGFLGRVLGAQGLPLDGSLAAAGHFITAEGAPARAHFVARAAAAGERTRLRGRVAVVDFTGLARWPARQVAEAAEGQVVTVATPGLENFTGLAARFDAGLDWPPRVPEGFDLYLFPPVLGLERPLETPFPSAEVLAVPPSPPGWRLQRALDRALEAAGVAIVAGEASSPEIEGDRLASIRISGDRFPARAFVLAGGRFVGGGLVSGRAPADSLLGLAAEGGRGTWGLPTDASMRPLRGGEPAFANVFAAGALLGGAAGRSGSGVAALTGLAAGRNAAR
ncbi:MAG: FAD-binding protein [Planctomycetes bacterium]|nr:FAD-binding protein [Planctomycetota bacterium]